MLTDYSARSAIQTIDAFTLKILPIIQGISYIKMLETQAVIIDPIGFRIIPWAALSVDLLDEVRNRMTYAKISLSPCQINYPRTYIRQITSVMKSSTGVFLLFASSKKVAIVFFTKSVPYISMDSP